MAKTKRTKSASEKELEEALYVLIQDHLRKLSEYVPGPVKKRGSRNQLLQSFQDDPVFQIFGLDSNEYLAATLAGGTITSIHRKIGDIYESCIKKIITHQLKLTPSDLMYSTIIKSGETDENRSLDIYLQLDRFESETQKTFTRLAEKELSKLTTTPKLTLVGIALEVRHCYQTADSKRTQADEAIARHLFVSGILPVMPLFCNQSNPKIIRRYQSVWVIKQGIESYEFIRSITGFDFYDFLTRHREEFRKPVIKLLRRLAK